MVTEFRHGHRPIRGEEGGTIGDVAHGAHEAALRARPAWSTKMGPPTTVERSDGLLRPSASVFGLVRPHATRVRVRRAPGARRASTRSGARTARWLGGTRCAPTRRFPDGLGVYRRSRAKRRSRRNGSIWHVRAATTALSRRSSVAAQTMRRVGFSRHDEMRQD